MRNKYGGTGRTWATVFLNVTWNTLQLNHYPRIIEITNIILLVQLSVHVMRIARYNLQLPKAPLIKTSRTPTNIQDGFSIHISKSCSNHEKYIPNASRIKMHSSYGKHISKRLFILDIIHFRAIISKSRGIQTS